MTASTRGANAGTKRLIVRATRETVSRRSRHS